ncbi:solute carrier family 25 member 33 [Magnaporthiopsis poae ATCC 64411]|uniref:Solute carrier family 25 member 33 n=1 Tax=Magnaporthiopsis poae (strain ATCC 64411 / 73-15) TaxID=644358 RepID=A0A0C4E5M0_MAGP6|nr:solute carrier family 25 member 33 [Magnaporthiopsis poae ATCC 64411]
MSVAKDAGGPSPALIETVAGLSAGTVATLVVHPLDIVKTRMQIHRSNIAAASAGSARPAAPQLTTMTLLRSLVQTQSPVAALYRGLTPNLVGNAASWASFFFLKSRCERAVMLLKGSGQQQQLTPADYFVSSALAGAGVQVLTNPVWVLKTRMLSSDRGSAGAYPSMWAGAARIWRGEGLAGFYRGLGISLLGVSHGAVQFAVYEPAKRMYLDRRLRRQQRGREQEQQQQQQQGGYDARGGSSKDDAAAISNEATVVISTAAKLTAGAVTYPYQVLRSRLQNYDAEARFGRGIVGVARRLWHEEGLRGFYRGLVPGVVRVLPATWVTFLVYENVKHYLPLWAAAGGAREP